MESGAARSLFHSPVRGCDQGSTTAQRECISECQERDDCVLRVLIARYG
jgi:hypothetical protein